MSVMKSSRITNALNGEYGSSETIEGVSDIFPDSQFFPAKDGTWLMVDWMSHSNEWYVTEGV